MSAQGNTLYHPLVHGLLPGQQVVALWTRDRQPLDHTPERPEVLGEYVGRRFRSRGHRTKKDHWTVCRTWSLRNQRCLVWLFIISTSFQDGARRSSRAVVTTCTPCWSTTTLTTTARGPQGKANSCQTLQTFLKRTFGYVDAEQGLYPYTLDYKSVQVSW